MSAVSYNLARPQQTNRLVATDRGFELTVPYGFQERIKAELQGSWDKSKGCWVIPPRRCYAKAAMEMFPLLEVSDQVMIDWESHLDFEGTKLYPYQVMAVDYLTTHPNALLALSPGLGKTAVSLTAAARLGLSNVLIVSPLSLLRTWEHEAEKWVVVTLTSRYDQDASGGWVVTNYDTVVGNRFGTYRDQKWDLVILDESILFKNRDTRRFKRLVELREAQKTSRFWELSGSPTSKYADDLWTQLHLLDPKSFRSYWRFTNRYCVVVDNGWGTEIVASRHDRDLRDDFADLMFSRNQEEVLPDLPEQIPMLVEVSLLPEQKKAYSEMERDFLTWLDDETKLEAPIVLSKIIRLQQIASSLRAVGGPDISAKQDAIEELLESGQAPLPCLIWTQWQAGAEALYSRLLSKFVRVGWVSGTRSQEQNDKAFEMYKSGQLDILICSLAIGKFGHTMTDTKSVIYLDKSWNADDYYQSLHRVRRIGLKHRPLLFTLKAAPVDDLVEMNLAGKLASISSITGADLAALLRNLRGGYVD